MVSRITIKLWIYFKVVKFALNQDTNVSTSLERTFNSSPQTCSISPWHFSLTKLVLISQPKFIYSSFFPLLLVVVLFCFDLAFILQWTQGDGCITITNTRGYSATNIHDFMDFWEVFTNEDRKSVILQVT